MYRGDALAPEGFYLRAFLCSLWNVFFCIYCLWINKFGCVNVKSRLLLASLVAYYNAIGAHYSHSPTI